MKAVQGDSGHARMNMVANVYSHIIDEDRKYNAQKFEEQFYNSKGLKNIDDDSKPPMPKFESAVVLEESANVPVNNDNVEQESKEVDSTELIAKLLSNPEAAALLKSAL